MRFIGREKEIKQTLRSIKAGKNIILTGKYGIGRTTLIRHVSEVAAEDYQFVFVDFSHTPGKICQELITELLPSPKRGRPNSSLSYKAMRFRIGTLIPAGSRKVILVLDNIAKITFPKKNLIRYLAMTKRFLFVAIAESFLDEDHFSLLRMQLSPSITIQIGHLNRQDSGDFFRNLSEDHDLLWTENQIAHLVETTGGYPLEMRDAAKYLGGTREQSLHTSDNIHRYGNKT